MMFHSTAEKAFIRMSRALPVPESWNGAQVGPFVAVAAAQRKYQPRRCLGGANAKDI